MNQDAHAPATPQVGPRQEVSRHALYGAGVVRPSSLTDVTTLGLTAPKVLPSLVVLATEHPHLPPPELRIQPHDGGFAAVLTWLEYDIMSGPLPEVAEVTYAWGIDGALPHMLILRKVTDKSKMASELTKVQSTSPKIATRLDLKTRAGSAVSLEPAYITRGVDGFFAEYETPRPPEAAPYQILAGIRPTAGGKRATSMDAVTLEGGGTRVRLSIPTEPGLPVWGPRGQETVTVFGLAHAGGVVEWQLDLR